MELQNRIGFGRRQSESWIFFILYIIMLPGPLTAHLLGGLRLLLQEIAHCLSVMPHPEAL